MSEWAVRTLGDVCEIVAGQSPPGSSYNTDRVGLPFYQGKKEFGSRDIGPPTSWTTEPTKVSKSGDILMSVRAPVGPVNLLHGTACIGRGLAAIRVGDAVDRDFIFYNLAMREPEIAGKEGAVFASINRSEIAALKIPLPPLEEQRRIVAVLDEAFAAIATATANAEKNLTNARELFQAALTRAFEPNSATGEGIAGKSVVKLGSAVSLVMGQAPAAADCNKERRGIPFVKVGEFGAERPTIREWTTDPKKLARETDVLICVVGATCGKINLGADCAIGRSVAAMRPNPDRLDQRYLWYFMQGKVLEMRARSQGAAQTVITREMIKEIDIPLPPLEEQRRIVAALDDLSAGVADLKAVQDEKLTALAALKQSLLHRAFSGELTTREPLAA